MTSPPSRGPGDRLREARERLGFALEQVARELHVDTGTLEQLEHDDYDRLGVPIFVKGHLRNYARLLALPADELVEAYEQLALPRTPELVHLRPEGPRLQHRVGWWTAIIGGVLVLLLLGLTVLWWYRRPVLTPTNTGVSPQTTKPAGPEVRAAEQQEAATTPAGPTTAAPVNALPGAGTGGDQPTPAVSAPTREPEHETGSSAQADGKNPASNPETPASRIPPATTGTTGTIADTQLVLRVREASWIEVYDGTGRRIYYDLAATGDTLRLSGVAPLRVFLGNSPGVDVSVNGKSFDQSRFQRRDNTARFQLQAGTVDSGNTR